jgi:hypothetical protein
MLIREVMDGSVIASDSELKTEVSAGFWLLERWAPNLATSFQAREQQIKIQHPALGPESVQNDLRIERH